MENSSDLFTKRLKDSIGTDSLRSFAKKAGISDGALRKYLAGKSEATRPVLISLAKVAGVNLAWLLTGEGSKSPGLREVHDSSLASYVCHVFNSNRRRGKGWNSDSVFLAGFSQEHLERLKQVTFNAANKDNRDVVFIDATGKTLLEIAEEYTDQYNRTNHEAFDSIEDRLIHSNEIAIFSSISKSKITHKPWIIKDLIKIFDDGHLRGTQPCADLVFIDKFSFLEKSWHVFGDYIQTNITFS